MLAPGALTDAVARLALDKAQAVAARVREGIVLGADTVVTIDGDDAGQAGGRR
jgi:predicted house-cleaning NTP pyrophosphatase (Maf/HAM1 superfamily)